MNAAPRSSLLVAFVAALVGGAVVAVALLVLDVGGGGTTTTVVQQAPIASPTSGASARAESGLTAHDIYERDAPGVLFVRSTLKASASSSPFGTDQGGEATGTGFVIDGEGHVLTNYHVVEGATSVTVGFDDSRIVPARVLGTDATNDLALLQVDPAGLKLTPLQLGDSKTAQVGDPVLAIGNPFGLDRTLTTGVVSALQRQITAPNGFTIQHVIQTDAPINPGNSGGPLLDAAGRVIGINSQIITGGAGNGNVGIGFAVPINTAKRLLPQLKQSGSVVHAYLGITGATIDASLADLQLRVNRGVLVQTVEPNGPAAKAGLHGGTIESQLGGARIMLGGDVIQSLDGHAVDSMSALTGEIAGHKPGDRVRLQVLRSGSAKQLAVTLGTAPRQAPSQSQAQSP
ncbi:MAG TPA: trypsin-like peptidase domain-containing protein [Conexibacter sp.]|jgi:S1-C subfamily serine protease|nr:trypsin-like peptidase domain-containing protein [Conexibacter sp.]